MTILVAFKAGSDVMDMADVKVVQMTWSSTKTYTWLKLNMWQTRPACVIIHKHPGWLHGTVVERRSFTGELSLSCDRPAADGWPLMWVNHPLQVGQLGQLSFSSFRGW